MVTLCLTLTADCDLLANSDSCLPSWTRLLLAEYNSRLGHPVPPGQLFPLAAVTL